jgi:hypothetical protein
LPVLTSLVVPIHQLLFVNFYLGTAEGALSEAKQYVLAQAKPWQTSGVAQASEDPYILELFGSLHSDVSASVALAEVAALEIEAAVQRGSASGSANCGGGGGLCGQGQQHEGRPGGDLAHLRSHGRPVDLGPLRLRPLLA